MRNATLIEDIEEMRQQQGIDDVELREAIRKLKVGDLVKLTFLNATKPTAGETLSVRITTIERNSFQGQLAERPTAAILSDIKLGSPVAFTASHIHSLPGG
jgi:hypothetical protein